MELHTPSSVNTHVHASASHSKSSVRRSPTWGVKLSSDIIINDCQTVIFLNRPHVLYLGSLLKKSLFFSVWIFVTSSNKVECSRRLWSWFNSLECSEAFSKILNLSSIGASWNSNMRILSLSFVFVTTFMSTTHAGKNILRIRFRLDVNFNKSRLFEYNYKTSWLLAHLKLFGASRRNQRNSLKEK